MKLENDYYEGKAKKMYPITSDRVAQELVVDFPRDAWVQEFKDDLTAFNALKKSNKAGKGACNQHISSICYEYLHALGFKTHYLGHIDDTRQVVTPLAMLPVECVVRRTATGSLVKRLGVEDGRVMHPPLFETFLKNDPLDDPLIAPVHMPVVCPSVDTSLLRKLELLSISMFCCLEKLFAQCELELVDGKFEFGRNGQTIVLGDEISPDTLRLWTSEKRKLDKDVFRQDLGDVVSAYQEVLDRLKKVSIRDLTQKIKDEGIASDAYRIACEVYPQAEVLDPEGQAALDVISQSKMRGLTEVKAGRSFLMTYDKVLTGHDLDALDTMAHELFANPLIHDWDLYLIR